jgi:uncharacterized protein YdhG (YjbR/CyaY superfamily)
MALSKQKYKDFDEYFAIFPPYVQEILQTIRKTVKSVAPKAIESITYHMPTLTVDEKYLLHFAAWKSHVAFYGISTGSGELKEALAKYVEPKGTIKFKFDEPIPYHLIKQMVKYKVEQNLETY